MSAISNRTKSAFELGLYSVYLVRRMSNLIMDSSYFNHSDLGDKLRLISIPYRELFGEEMRGMPEPCRGRDLMSFLGDVSSDISKRAASITDKTELSSFLVAVYLAQSRNMTRKVTFSELNLPGSLLEHLTTVGMERTNAEKLTEQFESALYQEAVDEVCDSVASFVLGAEYNKGSYTIRDLSKEERMAIHREKKQRGETQSSYDEWLNDRLANLRKRVLTKKERDVLHRFLQETEMTIAQLGVPEAIIKRLSSDGILMYRTEAATDGEEEFQLIYRIDPELVETLKDMLQESGRKS